MNMFARKQKPTVSQADAELNRKKCAGKSLDLKKDVNSRLKYLKMYIGKLFLFPFSSFFTRNSSKFRH